MKTMLSIAIPKGSLEEQTLLLFKQADLEVKLTERGYNPTIEDPRISKVKILRPQEIPEYVEQGYFDLGITGKDWIVEREADVVEVADLRYNKRTDAPVRIVLAVQQDSGIERPEQMPENAKISTEYPNITRRYFERLRIPVRIFFSYGATEAKDMMDGIVELTETGETLTKNNWRIIDVLMESTARLIANKDAWSDPTKRKAIKEIKTLLLGVLEARGRVLLSMNVRADRLESVVRALPALKRPTISRLYGDGEEYYAVETVVSKKEVNVLIPKLKELGAEDILEIDILKIVR